MAWFNYPVSHGYIPNYQGPGTDTPHFALDLATPFHTPITALSSGIITKADFPIWGGQPGGGEVFERPDSGGPLQYWYHLDLESVKAGQHVAAGDQLGLSGGQNQGGSNPTGTMWSSGAHTHFGLFEQYVSTPEGNRPFGPDPSGMLAATTNAQGPGNNQTPLFLSQPGTGWTVPGSTQQTNTSQIDCSFPSGLGNILNGSCAGQAASNAAANAFQSIFTSDHVYRVLFIIGGLALIWLALKRFTNAGQNINLSLPQLSSEEADLSPAEKQTVNTASKSEAIPKAKASAKQTAVANAGKANVAEEAAEVA